MKRLRRGVRIDKRERIILRCSTYRRASGSPLSVCPAITRAIATPKRDAAKFKTVWRKSLASGMTLVVVNML